MVSRQTRALSEVWYYKAKYGAPASFADIAYELGETPKAKRAILAAISRGTPAARSALPRLERRSLVRREAGGYVATVKGVATLRDECRRLDPRGKAFRELECEELV